jgi:hypothetical protein
LSRRDLNIPLVWQIRGINPRDYKYLLRMELND